MTGVAASHCVCASSCADLCCPRLWRALAADANRLATPPPRPVRPWPFLAREMRRLSVDLICVSPVTNAGAPVHVPRAHFLLLGLFPSVCRHGARVARPWALLPVPSAHPAWPCCHLGPGAVQIKSREGVRPCGDWPLLGGAGFPPRSCQSQ